MLTMLATTLVDAINSTLGTLDAIFAVSVCIGGFEPLTDRGRVVHAKRIIAITKTLVSIVVAVTVSDVGKLGLFGMFRSMLKFVTPPVTAIFLFNVF